MIKVLIVDDKTENLYLLQSLLDTNGFKTITAKNGAEALGLMRNNIPGLIIADILMPVMDGFTLCRECKKDETLKNIPFFFYTATYIDAKDEEYALGLGADRFILKPQEPDVFLKIITDFLEEVKNKNIHPKDVIQEDENIVLKEYNEVLIRKIEDKMLQTEKAEKELRRYSEELEKEIIERKKNEDSLRESQKYNRLLFNTSLIGLALCRMDGSLVDINPAFAKIIGRTIEETLNLSYWDITPEKYSPQEAEQLKSLEESGYYGKYEKEYIHKDGHLVPVLLQGLILERGGERFIWSSVEDITERKKAEAALQNSQHLFQTLAEVSPVGIFRTTPEGDTTYVNPKWSELSGLSEKEAFGTGWLNAVHPEDREKLSESWTNNLKLQNESSAEYRFLRPDGSIAWVLGKAVPEMIRNEVVGYVGTITDITEYKRAVETMLESEKKYRQLVTQSPDGIFITDFSGKFLSVNRAICENLKYTEEELLKLKVQNIVPEKYHSLHKERLTAILNGKSTNTYAEYEVKGKDGVPHFVEIISVPYYRGKEIIGFQGIARDITERKQMEDAIRESEEKYRSIYENSSVAILLTKPDGKILKANDFACKLFGKTENEICEAGRNELVDTNDPNLKVLLDERSKTGKSKGELTFLRKDGSKFLGEVSSVVFLDKDGKQRTSMVIRDLTEQRETEESLKFRNILLSTQMEVSIDGILMVDENNNIVSFNRRFVEIFKIPEALIGQRNDEPVLRYVTGMIREPELFLKRVQYLYEHKEETSFEELYLTDGRVIDRNSSPMFGSEGHYYGRLWNFRDVTNRKKAEEEIMKNEARFRSYFESAIAGIAITSPSKGWLEVNDYLCKMLGYSKDEIIRFTWAELTHPDDLNNDLENFNKVMMGKTDAYSIEKRFIRKDSRIVWTNMSVRCVRFADGTVEYFVALLFDISERKKFEDELIRSKIKAEESDKLKTAFLHNISHEIRTPMNAIVGFSALLTEPDLDETSRLSFIDTITQSSNQLLAIINDIIEISNIEAGIIKSLKNEIQINLVFQRLFDQFYPKAAEKTLTFRKETPLPDNEAIILADNTKFIQILTNLLSNAFKFTERGRIEFGYNLTEEFLHFYVSDTGIGIPEDQFQRIFDRFYQVEHLMARHFEGTGLGLSISKAFVEIMGGKIWVDSELGKGSVFYFTLPYKKSEIVVPEASTGIQETSLNKRISILVAEDDENNFNLILKFLPFPNITLIRARNGVEAVKYCESGQPVDLVLMDLKMPEMDGYEATIKIKGIKPDLPVIAQTAFVTDNEKVYNSGCVDIITKPFSKRSLLEKIEKYLKD